MEFDFDWDDANTSHVARHDVSIAEFEEVFENQPQIEYEFTDVDGQDRYNAFGFTNAGRQLKASFAFRGERIRPITAIDITTGHVTKQERTYGKQNQKSRERGSRKDRKHEEDES